MRYKCMKSSGSLLSFDVQHMAQSSRTTELKQRKLVLPNFALHAEIASLAKFFGWDFRVVNVLILKKDRDGTKIHIFIFYMTPHAPKINNVCQRTSTLKTCLISAQMSRFFSKMSLSFPDLAVHNGLDAWVNLHKHGDPGKTLDQGKHAKSGQLLSWAKIKHLFIVLVLWHNSSIF